jgi:hypothetical protein
MANPFRLAWLQDTELLQQELAVGHAPGPRECHVMLPWGEKLVVFAGNDNSSRFHDMYSFDGGERPRPFRAPDQGLYRPPDPPPDAARFLFDTQ